MALTDKEGIELVALARMALEEFLNEGRKHSAALKGYLGERRGVFVTLNRLDGSLRGCIGYPYPVMPLGEAVVDASISACSKDPRFPPMTRSEPAETLLEVSVLTVPEVLHVPRRADLPTAVRIGKDGLIVSNSFTSGLLLPQVATDFKMGSEEFLSETCVKASLAPDSWLDKSTRVERFQADIFSEPSPRAEARRTIP